MNDKKDIGALWLRMAKSGSEYMSGAIEIEGKKYQIVAFKNTYKKTEKQPDYRIFPSVPRDAADEVPF